ncbi:MAG: DUF1844 domain-containing protein [Bdellovibrio sp.]|nr:MAG: DUF1844 domain-containing protein [Bdellovibrio sp.]
MKSQQKLEANFSSLILSIASSAAMSLGLAPDPHTNKIQKNLQMATFNIDLLLLLREKTKNNLTSEEESFLNSVISDLQVRFLEAQKAEEKEPEKTK